MLERVHDAVVVDVIGDVVGRGLRRFGRIAHRHADAGEGEHVGIVAAVSERDGLLTRPAVMPHEPLHSLGFAAVGGNQVGEVRMPAHASDIATHAGQLRFIFKADVRADLERLILQRPLVRIVDVHGRCGLAELAPRGPHRVGDLVEVDVILLRSSSPPRRGARQASG